MNFKKPILYSSIAMITLSLVGCGGSGSSSEDTKADDNKEEVVTLSGKAATGKALKGKVEAVNAKGKSSTAVTVAKDGSFSIKVPKGAPYMLKAVSSDLDDQNGEDLVLFSFANAAGKVNITTFTNQAVFDASGKMNLAQIFKDWAKNTSLITEEKVTEAAKKVVANLKSELSAQNVGTNTNVFTADFKTDGTGLDAVLDAYSAIYNCSASSCEATYQVNGKEFSWDYNIATNTISFDASNIGGTTGAGGNTDGVIPSGTSTLTITGTISSLGFTSELPEVVSLNMPKPANESEFCGSGSFNEGTQPGLNFTECSYSGGVGRIKGTATANNITSTYDYTYTYS